MITITLTAAPNNNSLQIGDLAYSITPSLVGGFQTSINDTSGEYDEPIFLGTIDAITGNQIFVDETQQNITPPHLPEAGDFFMFAKDTSVNLSGLLGYYAEIEIKNNSKEKAEMFTIGSEITPSSK
jgi:hypothetical protein